jgi:hypothetical protein
MEPRGCNPWQSVANRIGAERKNKPKPLLCEQPAQFLDCLRLAVVLGQVLVDKLAECQRAASASLTPHPLQRPLATRSLSRPLKRSP